MCKKTKGLHNRIDKCMKNLISYIPNTFASCCGHGKYPMSIIVKNINGEFIEIISGIKIPRKKKFYVKDKQGYYYIPEVLNGKK